LDLWNKKIMARGGRRFGFGVMGVLGLTVIWVLAGCGSREGKPMPEFAMKTLGGEAFGNKDVRGRVALFYVSGEG
jgi:hypothetical protein